MAEKIGTLDRGASAVYGGVKGIEAVYLGVGAAAEAVVFAKIAATAGLAAVALPALGIGILLLDAALFAAFSSFGLLRRAFSRGGGHGGH